MVRRALALTVLLCGFGFGADATGAEEAHVREVKAYIAAHVVPWLNSPVVIDALRSQNAGHAGLTDADIEQLDMIWRKQVAAPYRPLIESVLHSELSLFLRNKMAASDGLVAELMIMDDKGMNVGLSDVSSDYWQGDEAKWQKSFRGRPDAIFVDSVEKDASTRRLLIQVSLPIQDPETGKVIGAIMVGFNVEQLS